MAEAAPYPEHPAGGLRFLAPDTLTSALPPKGFGCHLNPIGMRKLPR